MRISFDPLKREKALADRGLDFADAALVFEGVTVEIEDTRKDYGEVRIICYGTLAGRPDLWWATRRVARNATFSA
jgi:uncharacterized protein